MTDSALPLTRYALSGDVNIAYQVMGEGLLDIVMVPGVVSHVECLHDLPGYTAFLRRLSAFARIITFDKRGQGLSDRIEGAPSLEQRMDDVRAVMDAVGSQRAALAGFSEGGAMSLLFAATYPQRVSALVLFGAYAVADFMSSRTFKTLEERLRACGTGAFIKAVVSADHPVSAEAMEAFGKLERLSASPGALKAIVILNGQIDVRPILGSIRVPFSGSSPVH